MSAMVDAGVEAEGLKEAVASLPVGGYDLRIERAEEEYRNQRFVQYRVGLHHVSFRARERADVDTLHHFLVDMGAKIVHPTEDGPFAPGPGGMDVGPYAGKDVYMPGERFLDIDGDGIPTADEDWDLDGDPTNDDIDGDGIADLAVGANGDDEGGTNRGALWPQPGALGAGVQRVARVHV